MSVIDDIYNKQFNKAEKLISEFEGELSKVLDRVNRLSIAQLSALSPDEILSFNEVWQGILRDAGYYDLVDSYITVSFDSFYDDTLKAFEAAGLSTAWSANDAQSMDALKTMKRDFFIALGDDAGKSVQKELYRYALADANINEMTQAISESIDNINLKRYANTYARTAIQEYQQEIIDIRSADIDEGVWVYVGVNDGATRPFCKHVLEENTCYTDSEKLKLENDPAREFNCRHRFYKMSKDKALDLGYACS